MSNNTSVNYGIGLVLGIGVAFLSAGSAIPFLVGHAFAVGAATFAISSALLNSRIAGPTTPLQKPPDYRNSGRVYSGAEAAAKSVEVNSASEAIVIPVVFGTTRMNANYIRVSQETFRNVPIIERILKSREAVAYALARDTYRTEPAVVDHSIDEAAKKQSGGGGKGKGGGGGGKGGGKSSPPSQSWDETDKINQYTSLLLAADETGERRLPKEYDERTVGWRYYLTWELGICHGPVTKLHAIRSYPGEDAVVDRYPEPDLYADDTALTGEGGGQGGSIRFYRGTPTQTRNVADVFAADHTNYRGTCFALFDDYYIGNSPSPPSFAFEVERLPQCLDEDGDVIADMETRAGVILDALPCTGIEWSASEVTVDCPGHGFVPGDVVFLADCVPTAYNGTYVVTAADPGAFVAAMMLAPGEVTDFGLIQGPTTASPLTITAASWSGGYVSFDATGHGLALDQEFLIGGMTPSAYNGTYAVATMPDADTVTAVLVANPGTATVLGALQPVPLPLRVTAASWDANTTSMQTSGDHNLSPGDNVDIYDFLPTEWNQNAVAVIDTPSASELTVALEINPGVITTLGTARKRPEAGYGDANPAAILYELLTNRIWGLGLPPEKLDIPSFVATSQFFHREGIGMSFALESQSSAAETIEMVRSHVDTVLLWLGDRLYCRCAMDRDSSYEPRFILDSSMIRELNVTRQAWTGGVNELSGTFSNRNNNYGSEVATVHDIASVQTLGRRNAQSINFPAFSNRDVVEKAVNRMLAAMSTPGAVATFKMSRAGSHLFPTQFGELRWREWSTAEIVTTYWRVSEITDGDGDGESILVTLVEDPFATPIEGTSDTFAVPVPAYEGSVRPTDADLDMSDDVLTRDFGTIDIMLGELPITLSDADQGFSIFARKNTGELHGLRFFWKLPDTEDYATIGEVSPWAITGKLVNALSAGQLVTRDGVLELQLDRAEDVARLLTYCSMTPTDDDPLDRVTGAETNWLFIGSEIIQVSQAEPGSQANRVLITGYLRDQYGSEMASHAAGARFAFVYEYVPRDHMLRYNQVPIDTLIDVRVIPYDRRGLSGTAIDFTHTFTGLARKPLRIVVITSAIVAGDVEVSYRPRWHNRGSEIVSDIEAELEFVASEIPDGYETYVMPRNSAGADLLAAPVKVASTYDPEDGNDATAGFVSFVYDYPVGSTQFVVYQAFRGVLGLPVTTTP